MSEPRTATSSRGRWMAALVLLVTFLAGGLCGAAWERLQHRHGDRGGRHRPGAVFDPDGPLGERLHLSADQRRQVEAILAEDRPQADALFREMRPRMEALFAKTTARIRSVLDAEQQRELDRYLEERRRRWRAEHPEAAATPASSNPAATEATAPPSAPTAPSTAATETPQ